MIILVQARKAYGQLRYYPVNDAAKDLARLTHTATFTFNMMMIVKRMGATIELAEDSFIPAPKEIEAGQLKAWHGLKAT